MMRTVQLALADAGYTAALRQALVHSGPWHVQPVIRPDLDLPSVVVVDESVFAQLPLPLANPERVVLIARQDAGALAHAWDAGILSVVSTHDPLATVLLAVMAAALRVTSGRAVPVADGISPSPAAAGGPIGAQIKSTRGKKIRNN